MCYQLQEFQKARSFYTVMLGCCERCLGTQEELAFCYLSLAYTYQQLGEYKQSITYFRKELRTHSITGTFCSTFFSKCHYSYLKKIWKLFLKFLNF